MKQSSWMWRRLTDEQLEAAAIKWVDREGAHYMQHGGRESESLGRIVSNVLDEMNRRTVELRLFDERPGEMLYGGNEQA